MHHHIIIIKVMFMLLGGLIAAAGGVGVALWSDQLTRQRERDAGVSSGLREFRNDISEMIVLLNNKTGHNDIGQFRDDTHDQVLVFCVRIAEDIPMAVRSRFTSACDSYRGMQERDEKISAKFLLYRITSGKHTQGEAPIPNPFRHDQRTQKERMLAALEKLKDYAEEAV